MQKLRRERKLVQKLAYSI